MKWLNQIIGAIVWLFKVLLLVLAGFALYSLCWESWHDRELCKNWGDVLFMFVLLAVNGFIVWQTAKWTFFKPQETNGSWLLLFWLGLIFIYLMLLGIGLGRMGLGSSQ